MIDTFQLQVVQRSSERLHLMFRDEPDVERYRFFAARRLVDAYSYRVPAGVNGVVGIGAFQLTGTVNCPYPNDINMKTTFMAPSIKKKGLGHIASSWRGQTHIVLNITDPPVTPNPAANNPLLCPADDEILFLRVEKFRTSQGAFIQDPRIYVIPPPSFYAMPSIGLTLAGVGPNLSAVAPTPVIGLPLPVHDDSSMWISLPRYAQTITIQNDEAANGASMLMSWGKGMGSMALDGADQFNMTSTTFKDILLACNVGGNIPPNPQFSLLVSIVNTDV